MKDKPLNTAQRQIIVLLQSDRPCQELHVDETVFLSQSVVYPCYFQQCARGEYVMILHLPGLDVIIEELPLK